MSDKKPRLVLTGAIIFLSISILLSSSNISNAIRDSSRNHTNNYEYELTRFNDNLEELIKTLNNNKTN